MGDGHAFSHTAVVGIGGIGGAVDLLVVAAVVAVAAAENVQVDGTVGDKHIALACGGHVAADVGASEDGTHIEGFGSARGFVHFNIGVVDGTGALATTVDGVAAEVRRVEQHFRTAGSRGVARIVGIGLRASHLAGVATTVDGVDIAFGQIQRGDYRHGSSIVAAEEAADIIDAVVLIVARGCIGSVEGAGDVDIHRGGSHRGTVATGIDGVDLSTSDINMHHLRIRLITAAEKVADTVGVAGSIVGTIFRIATQIDRLV